ncbi:MAG: hypothetical protein LBL86_02300 [Coriobacteriales bacterium]|jgi:hypothetical protein|nr:hypothetical protein [Coriobacteriales bacterium]
MEARQADTRKDGARQPSVWLSRLLSALFVLVLASSAFALLLQSPLSPLSIQYPGSESSLYLYSATQLLDGNVLYRDIFDVHAPLVSFIDTFGLFVGGPTGVWALEVAFLVLTLVLMFAALRPYVGALATFLTCLFFVALVGYSLQGGNQAEEYALPFQVLALAASMDCIVRRRITLPSIYLTGISAALTFFLKPDLVLFWLPFVVVICVMAIRQEGWALALVHLVTLVFSAALVFVIILPWLYVNNALASCYEQVVSFYRDCLSLVTPQERLDALLYFVGRPSFVLTVVISLFALVRQLLLCRSRPTVIPSGGAAGSSAAAEESLGPSAQASGAGSQLLDSGSPAPASRSQLPGEEGSLFGRSTLPLLMANLAATLLVFAAMAYSGRPDEHLALQGLVCLVVPLAYLIDLAVRRVREGLGLRAVLGLALVVLLALSLAVPGVVTGASRIQEQRTEDAALVEQREVVEAVRRNLAYDEPIIVFGDDCWVYTAAGTYSATKYPAQPFSASFRPDLDSDFYRQVGVAEAALLVGRLDEGSIERYPGIGDYRLVFKNARYEVYAHSE